MASRFASQSLLLPLLLFLLLVTVAYSSGHDHDHDHHHHMLHDHNMVDEDPSSKVFFTLQDLRVGKTLPLYFRERDPGASPQFLPKPETDSIPFSSKHLPCLLQRFSLNPNSPQAKAMQHTLSKCESPPIKGETKFCSTSLESMLDFARAVFSNSPFKLLSTTHIKNAKTIYQNYTVVGVPREVDAPKAVACHSMPYPYAIFYCHSLDSKNRVFKVPLVGENGDKLKAVSICHMDTTQWNHEQASFRVLGIEPGSSHVCHIFPACLFRSLVMVVCLTSD